MQLTDGWYDFGSIKTLGNTRNLLVSRHSMLQPDDLYLLTPSKTEKKSKLTQLTFENEHILNQLAMPTLQQRWVKTTDGKEELVWIVLPPHFDANKKYPTLLFCEGGPQSPVSQFWSYRWNFFIMAAHGYVVVAPNRRGLPGFGSKWNEEISGDWTGQCMNDYLSAIDDAAANLPFVDKDRLGCVGASFGGFSVYYLAGHHNKRFKAFIAHDGAFNLESMYTDTEEVWFSGQRKLMRTVPINLLTNGTRQFSSFMEKKTTASMPTKAWGPSMQHACVAFLPKCCSFPTRTTGC